MMRVVPFPEQNTVYAEHQPQYQNLPAHRFPGAEGRLACCWRLSWRERLRVLVTGYIWHEVLTFGQPLQPQLLSVEKPKMKQPHD
ncbi:hypothetical protein K8I85_07820 [bacterium]|nr:hypothetical protein [bacterium]